LVAALVGYSQCCCVVGVSLVPVVVRLTVAVIVVNVTPAIGLTKQMVLAGSASLVVHFLQLLQQHSSPLYVCIMGLTDLMYSEKNRSPVSLVNVLAVGNGRSQPTSIAI